MNASLPTLPIANTEVDAAALPRGDIPLNHQVGESSRGFGPLLQQAVGALSEQHADSTDGMPLLPGQLQDLPQGGKLLPLLQQVLDAAAAAGTDAQAVFKDIAARLEQLSVDPDLDPGQALATAIVQFIDENPRLATSVDTGLLRGISGNNPLTPIGDSGVRSHTGATPQLLPARTAHGNATATAQPSDHTTTDSAQRPLTGLDKLVGELAPVSQDKHHAALDEAISLFRRFVSGNRVPGSSETLPRNDNLLTTAPVSTSSLTPAAQAASALSPGVSLNVPFNQAGWDKALGERIQWMVGQGMQRASIKLNPAHLGPMEVRIQVQNEQASVQFTAAHGVVREALEAALPRLRDMFDNAGVELTDVDVSGQSFAEQQQAASDGHGADGNSGQNGTFAGDGGGDVSAETPVYLLPESGRIDLFA